MSDLSDDGFEWAPDDAFPFLTEICRRQTKETGPGKRSLQSVIRPRQSQLYDNCIVKSIDGDQLCRISKKRCLWYVSRQLAEIVQDQPELVIRLNFVAKGGMNWFRTIICSCLIRSRTSL